MESSAEDRSLLQHRIRLEPLIFEWSAFDARGAVRCLPAIAILLGLGLAVGHPAAAMIAAGGAMSVGFGSFQHIHNSRVAPMLLATLGMCFSTLVGTVAGHSALVFASVAMLWGFLYGLLTDLAPVLGG